MRPSLPCPSKRTLLVTGFGYPGIILFSQPGISVGQQHDCRVGEQLHHPGLSPVVGSSILPQCLLLPSQPLASGTFTIKQMKSPSLGNAPLPTPNPNKARLDLEKGQDPRAGGPLPWGRTGLEGNQSPYGGQWPELRSTECTRVRGRGGGPKSPTEGST